MWRRGTNQFSVKRQNDKTLYNNSIRYELWVILFSIFWFRFVPGGPPVGTRPLPSKPLPSPTKDIAAIKVSKFKSVPSVLVIPLFTSNNLICFTWETIPFLSGWTFCWQTQLSFVWLIYSYCFIPSGCHCKRTLSGWSAKTWDVIKSWSGAWRKQTE